LSDHAVHGNYDAGQMEAYRAGVEDGKWVAEKERGKGEKVVLPVLKPGKIPQYIAAVAKAVSRGKLTAAQGSSLLYAAQVVISLMRMSKTTPPPSQPAAGDECSEAVELLRQQNGARCGVVRSMNGGIDGA
jgi:hypothetical protein